ncbi:unnamed protein product, partial [Closterium sp. Yama58-4]
VLLDRLVKPQREVKSYVTEITGLKEEDFEKVKYTWEDAQRDVAALLTPNTVLVGHHVSGDMDVLKIDHPLVIDTSLLFRYNSMDSNMSTVQLPLALVALRDLGYKMRQGTTSHHDSVEDSLIPVRLVQKALGSDALLPTPIQPLSAI